MDWQTILYDIAWPEDRMPRASRIMRKRFKIRNWVTKDARIIPFSLMKESHLRNALNYKRRQWFLFSPFDDRDTWIRTTWAIGLLHTEVWRRGYKIQPGKYDGIWLSYYQHEHLPRYQFCHECNKLVHVYIVIEDQAEWVDEGFGDEYLRKTTLICPLCHAENTYSLRGVGEIGLHYWNETGIDSPTEARRRRR